MMRRYTKPRTYQGARQWQIRKDEPRTDPHAPTDDALALAVSVTPTLEQLDRERYGHVAAWNK